MIEELSKQGCPHGLWKQGTEAKEGPLEPRRKEARTHSPVGKERGKGLAFKGRDFRGGPKRGSQ